MRFGTFLPPGLDGRPGRRAEAGPTAPDPLSRPTLEQAHFDSLWVYDHLHTHPEVKQESTFEAWTVMAAVEMIVHFHDPGEGDSLGLFASDVIPQLR